MYYVVYKKEVVRPSLPGTFSSELKGAPVTNTGDMTENKYLTLYGGNNFNMPGLDKNQFSRLNYRDTCFGNCDSGSTKEIYKRQRKNNINKYIRKQNKYVKKINRYVHKINRGLEEKDLDRELKELKREERRDLADLYEIKEYSNELRNNNPEINFNWQRNNINYPDWEKEWQRGWPGHHNKPSNTIDCDQTQFYCCPDNVTAKENEEGTNCPSYVKPEPEPDSTIDSENFWVL
tara:strand:- start:2027 stop:2728 length:702 start_codon:yes stop_codon:yes gene_type:complete